MPTKNLNDQLYDKMSKEQERFKAGLMKKPPAEILDKAYEFAVREDILLSMENAELSDRQATALLKSKTPLADVYAVYQDKETSYMDTVSECLESAADKAIQVEGEHVKNLPVYKFPAAYAREHDELDDYRASYRANIACKKAIEAAISEHYHDNHFDPVVPVRQVAEQFGYARMLHVLANTVKQKDWDARFSQDNKEWARLGSVYENKDGFGGDRNLDFVVESHSVLTNAFIECARHEYLLSLPLTKEDIRTEALNILSQFQNAREPNSPNGTHYMARVSSDFLARAKDKERDRMMGMLPFDSLTLSTLEGRKGIFAMISKDEDRFQKLRLRKPSVLKKLHDAQEQVKPASARKRSRDMER